MRWRGRERSDNVEDTRGAKPAMLLGGGGGLIVLLIMIVGKFMGAPQQLVDAAADRARQAQSSQSAEGAGVDDEAAEFISVVLKDTENVWTSIFADQVDGARYDAPVLRIFSGQTVSGCGAASSAMGPFYCPADRKIYIDPTFFNDLAQRHKAPGDFANAYVIAHEVAHHVQKLLGFSDAVNAVRARGDKIEGNRASVRLELQADYLAGVWAHHAQREYQILEDGDLEEAITAANQIGDDTLQREATGTVRPHSFTHGTSAQRVRWFKAGLREGKLELAPKLMEMDYDEL